MINKIKTIHGRLNGSDSSPWLRWPLPSCCPGSAWPGRSTGRGLRRRTPRPARRRRQRGLPAIPGSLAELAKNMSPTVVNIKVTKVENVGAQFMPFFKLFPNMMPQVPESRPVQGAGSGVIISADGTILTNNHVVEGAKEVTVTLADKQEYTAEILGKDPKTDLAVLKIKPKGSLQAATLGDSDQLQVGEWVMAVGNPFGLSHTVTSGIVSAKGRVIGAGPYDNFIQTDASINPGNSGGPLYNMKGELVGINTAIIPGGQGIGFAIPINTVKPLVPQMVAKGEVTRGYLGVNIQSVTPELAKALTLSESKGALVSDVVSGSPAEKAGIQRGDVIVSYLGKSVAEARDLSRMVAESPVGENASLTILRNGARQEINVRVERPEVRKGRGRTCLASCCGKVGSPAPGPGPADRRPVWSRRWPGGCRGRRPGWNPG